MPPCDDEKAHEKTLEKYGTIIINVLEQGSGQGNT